MRRRGLRGAIVWAIVPYVLECPVSVLTGRAGAVRAFETASGLARAARDGRLGAEQAYVLPGKLRPVVLLQDRPLGALPEFAALRLVRLETLEPAQQDRIRRQEARALFHLRDPARHGLTGESFVDVTSLVRVHESAIVGRPVGRLEEGELREIGERLVEQLDIDLTGLLDRRLRELLARARGT